MKISSNGLDLIKFWEQLHLKAYLDTGGVPTIGWGTILYPNGIKVKMGDTCTQEQAQEYLEHDCNRFEASVTSLVKTSINQVIFDALVCFVYNIGIRNFTDSTLLRLLNQKEYDLAAQQFSRWNKDNGKVLAGLIRRRESETKLFLQGLDQLNTSKPVVVEETENLSSPVPAPSETSKNSSKKKKG